jgi:sec-independent protein translocase protein TatC
VLAQISIYARMFGFRSPADARAVYADGLAGGCAMAERTRASIDVQMPLGDHLEELRKRLVWALLGLLPLVVAAFYFGEQLLDYVLAPARKALQQGDQPEITAFGPIETFSAYMRVSIIAAIVVGSPWIFLQLWRFVSPGLHKHEKRFVYFLVPLSGVLTAAGVVFLFKVVLPLILAFLIGFGTSLGTKKIETAPLPPDMTLPRFPVLEKDPDAAEAGQVWINTSLHKLRVCLPMSAGAPPVVLSADLYRDVGIRQQYRVSEVLSLMLTLILAFAGAFQMPLIILLLGWAKIVDGEFLKKYRRHAILLCAVIAAAVMPGDPASMMAMMIPLYLLYELGGVLLWLFPAHRVAGKPAPSEQDRPRLTSSSSSSSSPDSSSSAPRSATTEDEDDRP